MIDAIELLNDLNDAGRKDLRDWFYYCKDCEEHFRFWGRIGDPEG